MVGTIKLSYKHDDVIASTILRTFFETAGIQVIENHYDKQIDLREELKEFKIEAIPNSRILNDLEILLTDNLDDEKLKEYVSIEDIIIKLNYNKIPKNKLGNIDETWLINEVLQQIEKQKFSNGNLVKISYSEDKNKQGYINEEWLINEVLDKLSQSGLLNKQQESYLRELAKIYIDEDYTKTSILCTSGFILEKAKLQTFALEKQKDFVEKLKQKYQENKENIHIKYALINTAYKINKFCRDNEMHQVYSFREIIDVANELKGSILDKLAQMLIIQTEHNLSFNRGKAYYLVTDTLRNENRFNPSAHQFKGIYWASENDYERASGYFKNAIAICPENYIAWYNLGFCFLELNDSEKARSAFMATFKILEEKYKKNILSPMEIEYFYKSTTKIGYILSCHSAFSAALKNYGFAKRALESVEDSNYIKYLNSKINSEIEFAKQIEKSSYKKELEKKISLCKGALGVWD